jgi:uracil-DNA glycosylase
VTTKRSPTEAPGDAWPDRAHINACQRCTLWEHAIQGVPGEGPRDARIMLVGEQPGDEEDRQGLPFVGPAGRLLRSMLAAADIDVDRVYLTNAVKHFGWEPRGKRRIHKTPAQRQIEACHAWLASEIAHVRPRVIVALGATALLALLGQRITLREARKMRLSLPDGTPVVAAFHPSAVLRAPDAVGRAELDRAPLADLRRAAALAGQ